MPAVQTHADFERLSWHDCHIWGLVLEAGDSDAADWTSDLALDVDFIVEWICGAGERPAFRVAPATLTFHGVTDLEVAVNWGAGGHQTALHPMSIDRIDRERIQDQRVFLDRPYYRWRIHLNWPQAGSIAFGAYGFTQRLRAEPTLGPRQHLTRHERPSHG
jgi:hypothetical protein